MELSLQRTLAWWYKTLDSQDLSEAESCLGKATSSIVLLIHAFCLAMVSTSVAQDEKIEKYTHMAMFHFSYTVHSPMWN